MNFRRYKWKKNQTVACGSLVRKGEAWGKRMWRKKRPGRIEPQERRLFGWTDPRGRQQQVVVGVFGRRSGRVIKAVPFFLPEDSQLCSSSSSSTSVRQHTLHKLLTKQWITTLLFTHYVDSEETFYSEFSEWWAWRWKERFAVFLRLWCGVHQQKSCRVCSPGSISLDSSIPSHVQETNIGACSVSTSTHGCFENTPLSFLDHLPSARPSSKAILSIEALTFILTLHRREDVVQPVCLSLSGCWMSDEMEKTAHSKQGG